MRLQPCHSEGRSATAGCGLGGLLPVVRSTVLPQTPSARRRGSASPLLAPATWLPSVLALAPQERAVLARSFRWRLGAVATYATCARRPRSAASLAALQCRPERVRGGSGVVSARRVLRRVARRAATSRLFGAKVGGVVARGGTPFRRRTSACKVAVSPKASDRQLRRASVAGKGFAGGGSSQPCSLGQWRKIVRQATNALTKSKTPRARRCAATILSVRNLSEVDRLLRSRGRRRST